MKITTWRGWNDDGYGASARVWDDRRECWRTIVRTHDTRVGALMLVMRALIGYGLVRV